MTLSDSTRAELLQYARSYGRNWRSRLSREWLMGRPILREVRNTLGPNGIYQLQITDGQLTTRDLCGRERAV